MTVAAYRERVSGRYPIPLAEIRDSVLMLFGEEPTLDVLDAAKVDPVEAVDPPPYDAATHSLAEGAPKRAGGAWRQTWVVAAITPRLEDYRLAIQSHVDAAAISRRYDSGTSMASYVASTNETWAAEAKAFVAWRDAVWALVYAKLAAVEAGELEPPSIADLIAELPAIEWPAA